jgi:hypothetical protein
VQVGAGWDIPVSDESQVHGAVAASTSAARAARLDARSTARCELLAPEPATDLVKHAYGGRLLVSASANGVVQLIADDRHHPAVLAALIWRDANRGNDDATVVAIRTPTDKDPR